MRKENFLLLFLFITVLLIVFYPNVGWKIKSLITPQGENIADYKKVILENELLKTDLAKLNALKKENFSYNGKLLQAFVYSRYPFNFKNELLVNKGTKDGIKTGQPAIIPWRLKPPAASLSALSSSNGLNLFLVGKVKDVFENYSVVETIFDSNFQLSVKAGMTGVSSLLKGGNNPKLTLIPENSEINKGDAVYSASPDYPFGFAVGLVKNIQFSSDHFFKEADLETVYNPNDLQSIFLDISWNANK